MNAILRKLAASIVLFYADGTQAQTLVGTDFVLEQMDQGPCIRIDLSSNLLSRNKGLLCFYEAQGLLQQHAQLQSIRINEKELALTLSRELRSAPQVQIRLVLGENRSFAYTAIPAVNDRNVTFTISAA